MAKVGLHLIKQCKKCGCNFRQSRSDQLYCSHKCYYKDWIKRMCEHIYSICAVCQQQFIRVHSCQKYCSRLCRLKGAQSIRKRNGRGKEWSKGKIFTSPETKCDQCGNMFHKMMVYKKREHKRNFCSNNCKWTYLANHPPMFFRSGRGIGGKRIDLNNIYFRSKWEANYARYLNFLIKQNEIKGWEFEPNVFEFKEIKKGTRFYTPDFKVYKNNGDIEYHEVKGWMDEKSQTKLNRMAKYYPDIKIDLINSKRYRILNKQLKNLIPDWE